MTTWTEIPNSDLDQDSPLTQPLATAWRDNVRAATEGTTGAPVLSTGWHPYNLTDVGDGDDGEIYDFATDGAVASVDSPAFADGYEYAFIFESIEGSTGPFGLEIEMYKSVDAAYTSSTNIASGVPATTAVTGMFRLILPRLSKFHHQSEWMTVFGQDGSSTTQTTVDVIEYDATQQKIGKIRLSTSIGNFSAGRILMLRRRDYITG